MSENEIVTHLYCMPDAETYWRTPELCFKAWADEADYRPAEMLVPSWGRPDCLVIERWTCATHVEFLPSADSIIEWAIEWYCDECGDQFAADSMTQASKEPAVRKLFAQARDELERQMLTRYGQADELLDFVIVTWADDGSPIYTVLEDPPASPSPSTDPPVDGSTQPA